LPLTNFFHVQNSLYLQVLRSPILSALPHGTPAAGVSLTLRRGTRNGITELSHTAPLMLGWAAIALGIGPHSSAIKFRPAARRVRSGNDINDYSARSWASAEYWIHFRARTICTILPIPVSQISQNLNTTRQSVSR